MQHKVTLGDIAKELKTTAATVSRALADHPGISIKTKEAVQEAANRLKYKKNTIAASLKSGKTNVIGVIIPSAEMTFFGSVVHGIESIANLNGYNILIYQSNENMEHETKGIETFLGARVDGILASIAKSTIDFNHFLEVKARNIPMVLFDRTNDKLEIPSVVIDDFKGAFLATEHLIKQGYKRIAHITAAQHITIGNSRLQGYKKALAKYKISFDPGLVYVGDLSIESGKAAVKYFFEKQDPPDAIFAVEDFTALGVIKELKDRKIKVPGEVGVVGFANELFAEHISPALSTIDQQTVLMGKESIKLLLKLISGKEKVQTSTRKVVLEPIPVFRESSIKKVKPFKTSEN